MALAQMSTGVVGGPPIVSIVGEQDVANEVDLAAALARGIGAGDADLIVDLREVSFIGAGSIGLLVAAHQVLVDHDQRLRVRAPSACVRRVLRACDLLAMVEDP
jgi:anti-anti-sigma factor